MASKMDSTKKKGTSSLQDEKETEMGDIPLHIKQHLSAFNDDYKSMDTARNTNQKLASKLETKDKKHPSSIKDNKSDYNWDTILQSKQVKPTASKSHDFKNEFSSSTIYGTHQGPGSSLSILKPVQNDASSVEEFRHAHHAMPSLIGQYGQHYTPDILPSGKTEDVQRTVTTTENEYVIVTKCITKIPLYDQCNQTRIVSEEIVNKPISIGVTPNPIIFDDTVLHRLNIESKPIEPLNYLVKNIEPIHIEALEFKPSDARLHLEHIAPKFDVQREPIDIHVSINYDLIEDADLDALKTVRPINIKQRVVQKTAKETRSIPGFVEHEPLETSTTHTVTTTRDGRTGKVTTTVVDDNDLGKTIEHSNYSFTNLDSIDSKLQHDLHEAQQSIKLGDLSIQNACDIRKKGLKIIDTLKKQVEQLKFAAANTNQCIEELDAIKQREIQLRLNAHRIQLEKELAAKIAEQTEIMTRLQNNANILKEKAAKDIQEKFSKLEGEIKQKLQKEKNQLDTLRTEYIQSEEKNINTVQPWIDQQKKALHESMDDLVKQLTKAQHEAEHTLINHKQEIETEMKDRMKSIQDKLHDETAELRGICSMLLEEEKKIFDEQKQKDYERMLHELEDQKTTELRFISEAKNIIKQEISHKMEQTKELAAIRKVELEKQLAREKELIDKYCQEALESLEKQKLKAQSCVEKREDEVIHRVKDCMDLLPKAWENASEILKSRMEAIKRETDLRCGEIEKALQEDKEKIQEIYNIRSKDLDTMRQALGSKCGHIKAQLQEEVQKREKSFEEAKNRTIDTCKSRMQEIDHVYNLHCKEIDERLQKYANAIEKEKNIHQEELQQVLRDSRKRIDELTMNIEIVKERLLENKRVSQSDLKKAQDDIERKEKELEELRRIENKLKDDVFATEDAFEKIRREINSTSQALGRLKLGNKNIEAIENDYLVDSRGTKSEHVSERNVNDKHKKFVSVETDVDKSGRVSKRKEEFEM